MPKIGNCGDDGDVLAEVFGSRNSVRALLGLGQFCQFLEFHDLAAEWVRIAGPGGSSVIFFTEPRQCGRRGSFFPAFG